MKKEEVPLKEKKLSIVEGLARISKADINVELNEKERTQFEKALREDEGVKKISFQFGKPIGQE